MAVADRLAVAVDPANPTPSAAILHPPPSSLAMSIPRASPTPSGSTFILGDGVEGGSGMLTHT